MIKKYLRCVSILAIISILLSACVVNSQKSQTLSTQQKEEDFTYLYNILKDEYPLFELSSKRMGYNWLERKLHYLDQIKATKSDSEFYLELDEIVRDLGDGHTYLLDPQLYDILMNLPIPEDVEINNYEKTFALEPRLSAKDHYAFWLATLKNDNPKYYNMMEKSLSVFRDNLAGGNCYSHELLDNNKTLYLKLSSFMYNESDIDSVYEIIKRNSSCENIILDIRGNEGGRSRLWSEAIVKPLLKQDILYKKYIAIKGDNIGSKITKCRALDNKEGVTIYKYPDIPENIPQYSGSDNFTYLIEEIDVIKPNKQVDFSGDIFLLVDKKVYSSSENFTHFCKSTGFAEIIGEQTRGDGSSLSGISIQLPNSGLLVHAQLSVGLNVDGTSNIEFGTTPDIEVTAEFALDKALEIIKSKQK